MSRSRGFDYLAASIDSFMHQFLYPGMQANPENNMLSKREIRETKSAEDLPKKPDAQADTADTHAFPEFPELKWNSGFDFLFGEELRPDEPGQPHKKPKLSEKAQ
ncbi:hypothetical protein JXJ21_21010 [candidate division KSB1 bacterium]|nr:hypothetical protein [candidate division KSB1 bacterium]